jgi:hypothetical protein
MPALRPRAPAVATFALLVATGCAAAPYVPTQRMAQLRATMDPVEAAHVFERALGRSIEGYGLCKAPFGFDDPKAEVSMDDFTVQAWRAGEETGRRQEGGRTVISYKKVRYAETRRFADLKKIRITREAAGMCAGPVPPGQVAITLHDGRVAVPLVLAVSGGSLDDLLAALSKLAPQAALIEGTGL